MRRLARATGWTLQGNRTLPKIRSVARALFLLTAFVLLSPAPAWACAACYGASDSPMAQGMNWGIFSLLGVIGLVLGGVAAFFIYLARRAASTGALPSQPQPAGAGEAFGKSGAPEASWPLRLGQPRSGELLGATSKI